MRRFLLTKPLTVLLSFLCAASLSPVFVVAVHAEFGFQSDLTPIITAHGTAHGTGHVDVSPTADDTVFIVQGTAEIHDALPSTTYDVQRAIDSTPGDGVCTIAPSPPVGWTDLTTFKTSPAGAGAGHFVRMAKPPRRSRPTVQV